jgi:hypothetical protein
MGHSVRLPAPHRNAFAQRPSAKVRRLASPRRPPIDGWLIT